MGLIRLRVAVLAMIMAVLALAAGRIFDAVQGTLVLGAVAPIAAMFLVLSRRWYVQVPVAIVAVVVAVVARRVDRRGAGARRRRGRDRRGTPAAPVDRVAEPDPPRPDRRRRRHVGRRRWHSPSILASKIRWHLLPLAPPLLAFIVICALSAAKGSAIVWLIPLAPLAVLFTVLRPGSSSTERLRILAGEHLLLLTAVATGLAAAVTVPVVFTDRADPRQIEPAETVAPVIDPIEATIALRQLDPPIVVYDVRATDGSTALPARWRTATRDTYDGQRWTPTLTLRPIGRRLAPDQPGAISAEIAFGSDDVAFVPLPGTPIEIGADVQTDPARTVVQLVDRPVVGLPVAVTTLVAPGVGGDRRRPDRDPSGRRDLGRLHRSGEQPRWHRNRVRTAQAIEAALRDDYALDPGAPGGGMQLALIQRFLTETRRGNAEQFATAFVLLARSLGVNARVATGFVAPPAELDGRIELRSDLARTWPEVEVPGRGLGRVRSRAGAGSGRDPGPADAAPGPVPRRPAATDRPAREHRERRRHAADRNRIKRFGHVVDPHPMVRPIGARPRHRARARVRRNQHDRRRQGATAAAAPRHRR